VLGLPFEASGRLAVVQGSVTVRGHTISAGRYTRGVTALVVGVAIVTAAIFFTQRANAQEHGRLEIAPALGAYAPFGGVPFPVGNLGCPAFCELASFRESPAVAVGGRIGVWPIKRLAIEGSAWLAFSHLSDTAQYTGAHLTFGGASYLLLTSLRGVLKVATPAPTVSVLVMAGPAVVHRAGHAWSDWEAPTSLGGAFGLGVDIRPGHGATFRATIEDYVYTFESKTYFPSESRHDVVVSLSILFGRRGEDH
jgi:hypothetical protein